MKVLVWTQYYWPEHFHINEVTQSLKNAGEEVTVLTGKPNYPNGAIFNGYRALGIVKETHCGIDVIRLPLRSRKNGKALNLSLNYLSFVASCYVFGPLLLRRKHFDVVLVYAVSPLIQALPAILFARTRGIPLVLWVQDLWPDSIISAGYPLNRYFVRALEWICRYIYRNSDLLLIQSEGFRGEILQNGIKNEKITFHANSSGLTKAARRSRPDIEAIVKDIEGRFSIVYAGNIGSVQSLDVAVKAAVLLREHKDVRFYLIGGGSMALEIKDEINKNSLENLVLHPWVSPDEIGNIFQAASVLFVSLKNDEKINKTIPNKLLVYMSAGKPIIMSGSGEAANLLKLANAGLVCPPGDPKSLADAILYLKNLDINSLKSLGNNGENYFLENFELNNQTKKLMKLFREIVAA